MNTQSPLPRRLNGRHTGAGAAILMASFGILPVSTIADQPAATTSVSRVADVSLSDVDLSTPEGMRVARDRLHTMAQRVCAGHIVRSQRSIVARLGDFAFRSSRREMGHSRDLARP